MTEHLFPSAISGTSSTIGATPMSVECAMREIERLRRVLTEIMESAEHHDADACHEMARLALRWPQQ